MNVRTGIALLVAALAMSLVLAGAANAKGPIAATITGPGLEKPLKLSYRGVASRTVMGQLTMHGKFFDQAFTGITGGGLPAKRPPAGSLGPRYLVVYTVPGPGGNSFLRQRLYPFTKVGAVTFMAKGQRFWGTRHTRGGWSRGSKELTEALVAAGLPAPAATQ